ncbi:hypothetical protein ACWD0A_32235 [Streptomyces sp. NPDC002867]
MGAEPLEQLLLGGMDMLPSPDRRSCASSSSGPARAAQDQRERIRGLAWNRRQRALEVPGRQQAHVMVCDHDGRGRTR